VKLPAPLLFGRSFVPAPTGTEAAEIDRDAIQHLGVPQSVLMENAGRSAAELVHLRHPRGRVVVVCGGGNNGGDGIVVARTLRNWGREVAVLPVADRGAGDPLLHHTPVSILPESDGIPSGTDVLVDAVLGTGLRGAPRERQAHAIRAIRESERPVVALDIPSGVDGDSGAVPGEAVRASLTVAFGWPKLGTLLHPGRGYVGELVAVEIGFPPFPEAWSGGRVITPGWAALLRPRREAGAHKNQVGSLLLLAGSPGMAGAAILAARAALRCGVGLLRIASPPSIREILQTAVPEALVVDCTSPEALHAGVQASAALAAGPGMGTDPEAARALAAALGAREGRPLVLDADALTLAASGGAPGLAELGEGGPLLLTPHPGEMARITGRPVPEVMADRPGAAREGAARFHATLLLKGDPSLVASPGGALLVSSAGSTDLATAGMGDVLTGAAGAFLAQGGGVEAAAALALHHTGTAALQAGLGPSLSPEDVVAGLPGALAEEGDGNAMGLPPFVTFRQGPPR